jgi:hypothetical protein
MSKPNVTRPSRSRKPRLAVVPVPAAAREHPVVEALLRERPLSDAQLAYARAVVALNPAIVETPSELWTHIGGTQASRRRGRHVEAALDAIREVEAYVAPLYRQLTTLSTSLEWLAEPKESGLDPEDNLNGGRQALHEAMVCIDEMARHADHAARFLIHGVDKSNRYNPARPRPLEEPLRQLEAEVVALGEDAPDTLRSAASALRAAHDSSPLSGVRAVA